ncbi:hypothetical protein [Enterobacter mori]|uniref:hypothetical protein n=1 Tax=Enterobacter mori TaxID=539813 RepID=UPI001B8D4750|nr:hypothetical protein [Enterobacter mori]MBS3050422.1 hypothetical protein [Enterobacter mori]
MPEITQPDIIQTATEKVLIKHVALKANRYQKKLLHKAQKGASALYNQAQQEAQIIQDSAWQQGYQDGVTHLLTDLVDGLEQCQRLYRQTLERNESKLEALLTKIFSDVRLQSIINDYFISQPLKQTEIKLYVPEVLFEKLKCGQPTKQNVTLLVSQNNSIVLEVDNEIIQFCPARAAQQTLPRILSLPARCNILQARKKYYKELAEFISQTRETNESEYHPPSGSRAPEQYDNT